MALGCGRGGVAPRTVDGVTMQSRYPAGSFTQIPVALVRDGDLGKVAIRIGMLMSMMKSGRCWMSTRRMASELGCSRSAVIASLAELVRRGHIVREERPGASTVYILQYPAELSPGGPENRSPRWSEKQVTLVRKAGQGVTDFSDPNHKKNIYNQNHRRAGRSSREPCMMLPILGGKTTDAADGQRHEHEARQEGDCGSAERIQRRAGLLARANGPLIGPDNPWKNRLSSHRHGDHWPEDWGPDPSGDVPNPKIAHVTWSDWRQRERLPPPPRDARSA